MVLRGYCTGLFPMGEPGGRISWYSPEPRGVFPLDDRFHVPYTLKKTIRRGVFETRINADFPAVIRACGVRPEGTWITPRIVDLYSSLHRAGYAHSVESWKDGKLAGGLYGVSIGAAFFGESMFSRARDASKAAFVTLVRQLARWRIPLVDCQVYTPHLASFGATEWPRREFLAALARALEGPTRAGRWSLDDDLASGGGPSRGPSSGP